jgi:photosystem II stability/assembly factor-like uncharacterized protein
LRTSLLVALILAAPAAAPAAQTADWQVLAESPFAGYRWEDGSFVDPQTGWIVEGGGRVYRTLDAGATWEERNDVPGYLRTAVFTSATHGWVGVLFHATRLYETSDAGATMVDVTSRIAPAIPGGICGMWAVNADTLVGAGQWSGPAYIVRTVDGGATWQSANLGALAGSLVDVVFLDDQRGFAVGGTAGAVFGGRAVVLATEDGGATWTSRYVGPEPPAGVGEWAWKITFPTPLVGYVSVERTEPAPATGRLLKTTDGGLTWAVLAVPGVGSMQGAGFLTEQRGWVSGRGAAAETQDGGLTWTPTSSIDGSVNRFEFFGDSLGFAMGQRVYALDARPVTPASDPDAPALASALDAVWPNPSMGVARIRFSVPSPRHVNVAVFDALGRRVATLADGGLQAGAHEVAWDGRTDAGAPAAAGVYVVRLAAGGSVATRTFAVHR